MKRVVITGLGAITPLGNTVEGFWENIKAGKSGARPISKFDASRFKTRFACEVDNFDPLQYLRKKDLRKYDLFTQYAIAGSDDSIKDAGLDFSTFDINQLSRVGVVWASGNGGIRTFEEQVKEYYEGDGTPRFNPYFIPKMILDIAAGVISIRNKLHGPNFCTVSACASSNNAIASAFDIIRLGKADIMISGGSEAAITESAVGGFSAAKALSTNNDNYLTASRPFDTSRDGFIIGEGAASLILEEYEHAKARGANIYAEILGSGMAGDAYHLTGTPENGIGAMFGMKAALHDAQLTPDKIDYINTHATSTPLGDLSELNGIAQVFKNQSNFLISATKSMTGHLLGAAGALEAIVSVLSVKHDFIPATINTNDLDPKIPEGLKIVVGEGIEKPVNYALNNTFGFGGHVASTIFKKFD